MSNEIVNWKDTLAQHAQKQAASERPSVGKITFRSGLMSYQGTPIAGNTFNCIVLAAVTERALYQNVIEGRMWDPNKPENPTCFALRDASEENAELTPHRNSRTPMATACKDCRYNAWGSDPISAARGGRAKACKDQRRLLILPQTALIGPNNTPQPVEKIAKTECAIATLPVTSVRHWANYVSELSSVYARPSWAVLTRMFVVPHPKSQFEVKFEWLFSIPEAYFGALLARVPDGLRLLLTPYTQDAAPPPAAQIRR